MDSIVKWAENKENKPGAGFYVDRHYIAGRWHLAAGPIRLAPYHRDILAHCFQADADGRWPYSVVAWCEPAKSGKSAIAGLCAQYAALAETNSTVVMASNKRDQAKGIMFKSLADSLTLNPALRGLVDPKSTEVNFNGTLIRAIPSNSAGESGQRHSLALFDELWAYVHTDATRLWSEFKPDPTRQNSMRFAIGYAGYLESELWLELLQTGLKGEPVPELVHITNPDGAPTCWRNGSHFTFWSHTPRQPWQTEKWLSALGLSFNEIERMIYCRFVEGIGNFLDDGEWQACITDLAPLPAGSRQPVWVGLDLAIAAGGDDCALVGIYADDDRIKLAFHKLWKGGKARKSRLKLGATVKPYLLQLKEQYNLVGVYFDPHQAELLAEELRAAGITCIPVPQSRSSRAPKDTRLQQMVRDRQIALYSDPAVEKAAAGVNCIELGNGLIFIKRVRREATDFMVALSNVANEPIINQPARLTQSVNPFYGDAGGIWSDSAHWWEPGDYEHQRDYEARIDRMIKQAQQGPPIQSYVSK